MNSTGLLIVSSPRKRGCKPKAQGTCMHASVDNVFYSSRGVQGVLNVWWVVRGGIIDVVIKGWVCPPARRIVFGWWWCNL